jgi:hypothetical protein
MAFSAKYPEMPVTFNQGVYFESSGAMAQAMISGDSAFDVYRFNLSYQDFANLLDKGYCADLSSSQMLAEQINKMYPFLRDSVTRDGKFYALPVELYSYGLSYSPMYWKEAGLEDRMPKSFLELIEFMNWWAKEGKEAHTDYMLMEGVSDYRSTMLDMALNLYMQYCQAQGEDLAFDTPLFRKLMAAVDSYIPTPERDIEKPFLMPVEDIFTIQGRGTVATGRVERGKVKVNESVEIVGIRPTRTTVVTGVEMFKKLLDEGVAGDNVGLLLRGIDRKDIERGQVIAKPGSITPHTKFKAEAYVLTKEEGGRHTPFFTGYRPQFYFRTTDVTGLASLPAGVEMVMPGDNVAMEIELIAPIAMEKGLRFAIREGGRTVGAGTVSEVVE